MHSNPNFYASNPYYAKSPASLSAVATNASNFLFVTNTKPASLQIPATIYYTKRCLDNNPPFLLSLTLSASLFLLHKQTQLPAKCSCSVGLSSHKQMQLHHTSLLSYIIDPLRHRQQIFTSVTLISTPTPTTFADITQSAINTPAFLNAPHPTKLPKSI